MARKIIWPNVAMRILYALPITAVLFLTLVSWWVIVGAALGFMIAVWTHVLAEMRQDGYDTFKVFEDG